MAGLLLRAVAPVIAWTALWLLPWQPALGNSTGLRSALGLLIFCVPGACLHAVLLERAAPRSPSAHRRAAVLDGRHRCRSASSAACSDCRRRFVGRGPLDRGGARPARARDARRLPCGVARGSKRLAAGCSMRALLLAIGADHGAPLLLAGDGRRRHDVRRARDLVPADAGAELPRHHLRRRSGDLAARLAGLLAALRGGHRHRSARCTACS